MSHDIHKKFSSNICSKCGGPAPGWKCPACNGVFISYDPRHFTSCPKGGKIEAMCQKCREAESKCTCV